MPIRIDKLNGNSREEIAFLCENEWEIPAQLDVLAQWLVSTGGTLSAGDYVADLGFSPRDGAAGGGAELGCDSIKIMASLGMSLVLSEYPAFVEEESENNEP